MVTGGVPQPVPGLRRKALLAVLALNPGEVISTDRLIDVIWNGRPPATALNTLQRHVSALRGLLGGRDVIVARSPGYLLDLREGGTDLQVFTRLLAEARSITDPAQRVVDPRRSGIGSRSESASSASPATSARSSEPRGRFSAQVSSRE